MADNNGSRNNGSNQGQGCTQAQLRRFIKSRAYVPMHELRRRFGINGEADDVRAVRAEDETGEEDEPDPGLDESAIEADAEEDDRPPWLAQHRLTILQPP